MENNFEFSKKYKVLSSPVHARLPRMVLAGLDGGGAPIGAEGANLKDLPDIEIIK